MPEPPVRRLPLGRDVELRLGFMQEQQQLIEERRRAVAAAYGDVLRKAQSQAAKMIKGARPTLEQMADVMGELSSLLAAVTTCRDAWNAESPDGRRSFHDARLTLDVFARLVATGDDATGLLDLPGAPRPQPSSRDGLTRADIQQLIDGGGTAQPEGSPVPQLAPVRTVGFAQPIEDDADSPGQLGEDTSEQLADDSRSGQRVGA
jgi:hypothetical protein